ncbi:MAG: asparagine--tRNA ligase [Chlamydiales bacterium]|nr:asparagine--tRNA ligase [Chlamydiales bacterium]
MNRTKINAITKHHIGSEITICGWLRTIRNQKAFSFLEINDGSTLSGIQVVADESVPHYQQIVNNIYTGASLSIKGVVVESPGREQNFEIKAKEIDVFDPCKEDYPLQKKRHSFEFLRDIAHLRPRTNTQGAVARVRSAAAFAIHEFFQERGFVYVHSPIITASDCEGAGELFQVTTLSMDKPPRDAHGIVDYKQDFFGKKTFLTVSGQLNGEAFACALSDIYTFGPTFRAENSNTSRHVAEFWMIEPEMAFADLKKDMEVAEKFIKYVVQKVLERCPEDMAFFDKFIENGLIKRLEHVLSSPFAHITYTEAIQILTNSNKKFEFPFHWGSDLQSEHERYIAEEHCKKPVIITDYPRTLKAFYMKDNDDGKTVAAMDILVPKIGEIIGGSQREDRLDVLLQKAKDHHLDLTDYQWYLDLRKYGSVPHAGFGLGFERMIQFVTGMENIRDVNAFPRTPGHCDY